MAKIYYSIDTSTIGYPVHWLDLAGKKHMEIIEGKRADYTPGDVGKEFDHQHPGAVYLKWDKFCERCAWVELERAKLLAWNAWAKA